MKIRKILLSTVMGAAVLMAAGPVFAAQTLQPDGNWAVTRIPGKSGDAYCAMARRYGGDVILTFARNASDEMSLAVDFQKDKLTKGQGYDVTLSPGSGQERSYNVEPVSGKAVVIRLGRDPAFHDALARSGTLGLDIAGEQYAFNAPDIGAGMKDVGGCLASLAEPAAGDEKPQAQSVAPVERKVVAVDQTMAPAQEADLLREENDRLRRALERERREFENRFQSGDTSNVAAELNEKIRVLEMDNENLKRQIGGVQPAPVPAPVAQAPSCPPPADPAEASKVTAAMAKELTDLRGENAKLRQQAAVAAPVSRPVTDPALEKELTALRAENGTLRGQVEGLNVKLAQLDSQMAQDKATAANGQQKMDAQSVATIGRLQGRVEVLEAENASLKESLRAAQAQVAAVPAPPKDVITMSQLRSVEDQLKSVESERDTLRSQIEAMRRGKEDAAVANIGGGDWSLEQATRRFNEAEREIRRLGAQIEQERTQCSAEKKEIEYKLFDPAIATQEQIAKLSSLEQELAAAKASSATDVTGYEQQISELKQTVAAKDSEIASLRDTVNTAQQRMAAAAPVSAPPTSYVSEPLQPQKAASFNGDARRQEMNEKAHIVSKPLPETAMAVQNIAPAAGAPVTEIPAANAAPVSGESDIVSILAAAGINNGGIKKVRDAAAAGYDAYSWESGGLFGSAEVRTMSGGDDFDTLVNRYVERTKGRCSGDFASIPAPDAGQGGTDPVRAVEVACVGGDASASASVVFFRRGNSFVTIAHEAPVDGMDMAMDARDRIAASLTQGKLASR